MSFTAEGIPKMSGTERMKALTGGHMASAAALAAAGLGPSSGATSAATGGTATARNPGERAELHSKDTLG